MVEPQRCVIFIMVKCVKGWLALSSKHQPFERGTGVQFSSPTVLCARVLRNVRLLRQSTAVDRLARGT